jgi:hypothetical protein
MSDYKLSEETIKEMIALCDLVIQGYNVRDQLMDRYEEIYFMTRSEKPKGLKVDEQDIKVTVSSSGRNAVTGLKRILDTSEIQIKVKVKGDVADSSDKIEAALKTMLRVSGEYRQARIEKDTNLSAALYGPAVLLVESVQDLVATKRTSSDDKNGAAYSSSKVNEYVVKQLEMIQEKTPFLLRAINPRQSYPEWGEYGLIGHVWKYSVKGSVLKERWGASLSEDDLKGDYIVRDFFHYCNRLVTAEGVTDPLFAGEWVSRDEAGQIIGSINIPIFARYAGGSSLFFEPEKQMQPLLYGKAKGEWDLFENLYWTYLRTAMYTQGLPGPLLLIDPENQNQDVKVKYDKGIRTIVAKAQLADPQVIDGDVLRLKELMDNEDANSTIQPQTLGQNTEGVTFSQFAMASKAGLIPAQDPKEAEEQVYKDAFTHILQRIKEENIPNDLIEASDIPDKFELEVKLEPDLAQDDLRNAQIVTNLKQSGANVSDEWINSTLLKIADSAAMFKKKSKEDIYKAIVGAITSTPEFLQPMIMRALGMKPTPPPVNVEDPTNVGEVRDGSPSPQPSTQSAGTRPSGRGGMPVGQTDSMILPQERQ